MRPFFRRSLRSGLVSVLSVSLLAVAVAGCGGEDEPEVSVSPAEISAVTTSFADQQKSSGFTVRGVHCVPAPEQEETPVECVISYRFGPSMRCLTAKADPSGSIDGMTCGPRESYTGQAYRECLDVADRQVCNREAQRRVEACIDTPDQRQLCIESIYGKFRPS